MRTPELSIAPAAAGYTEFAGMAKPARLAGIPVPEELRELVAVLEAAYAGNDPAALLPLLARDFLYQGMNREAFLLHLGELLPLAGPVRLTVLRVGPDAKGLALLAYAEAADGVLAPSLQALPLNAGARLVREAGQWRLHGNQSETERALYRRGEVISCDLAPADPAFYRALLPAPLIPPARPAVRLAITDWQEMEPPQLPYRLASLAIRARRRDREGWLLVQMPETDWLAVSAGRRIGFPKFMADLDFQTAGRRSRFRLTAGDLALLSGSFEADPAAAAEHRPEPDRGWWLPPRGGVLSTADMRPLAPFQRLEQRHGWLWLEPGSAPVWRGLIGESRRLPALHLGFTGPMKLVVSPMPEGEHG